MGAHPWVYYVKYQPDLSKALHELRQREFQAGRYNPVVSFPEFPITEASPSPGPRHKSIDEALEDSEADGTRSILDMKAIGDEPDYGVVVQLNKDELLALYGTETPTLAQVEALGALEDLDRGHGVCVFVYEDQHPVGIVFCGYSYD
jgi:hypothetical protein